MGRSKKSFSDKQYACLDLNEGNVQAIFNRCLATKDSKETSYSRLYLKLAGYEREDTGIVFDKRNILNNKKNIEYLFGQLYAVHHGQLQLKEADFYTAYTEEKWTTDRASIMQLIYLSTARDIRLLGHSIAKLDAIPVITAIKPTLSPKDPAFPAWWEAHKAEWED